MKTSHPNRILYIKPGPVPPPLETKDDEFFFLSDRFEGDILLPVWGTDFSEKVQRGNFTYHLNKSWNYPTSIKLFLDIFFYIFKGLSLYYFENKKFQVIITYGTNKTGISALILKILTGSKLIVDVPGNPSKYSISDSVSPSLSSKIKNKLGTVLFSLVCSKANLIKLLYPSQLENFPEIQHKPTRVFFAMTPLGHIEPSTSNDNFIFFLGSPWYLKGVDLLIKAFFSIKDEFPDINLKIGGHTDNIDEFKALTQNNPRIELLYPGIPHEEAMGIFARCSLFVLPSRTEAMGKVLLEAMACQKPVIGANVDGIPTIVKDGYNGLLFEKGDSEDLASKLRIILSDKAYADTLAKNGRSFVQNETSNERYLELFSEMIESCLQLDG